MVEHLFSTLTAIHC